MPKTKHSTPEDGSLPLSEHRPLYVSHPRLTLAKRPSESRDITELHSAIKALAREAARTDHSQDPQEPSS